MISCAEKKGDRYSYPTIRKTNTLDSDIKLTQVVSFAEVDTEWIVNFVVYVDIQNENLIQRDCKINSYSLNLTTTHGLQNNLFERVKPSYNQLSLSTKSAFFSYKGLVDPPENFQSTIDFILNDDCFLPNKEFSHSDIYNLKREKITWLHKLILQK